MRLMIVDDEPLVRIGIRTILEARSGSSPATSYEVAGEAGDGLAAVEMALALKPDLVLVDVKMPFMNGLEFIERVKPSLPRTRYVVLSCINEFESVRGAMRLGVTDYIIKTTLDADELIAIIEKIRADLLLELRSGAAEAGSGPGARNQEGSRSTLLALSSGERPAPDSLRALMGRLAPADRARAMVIRLEAGGQPGSGRSPLALASAVNICQEVLDRSGPSLCTARGSGELLALMPGTSAAGLEEICRTLLRSLEEYLGIAASIGLGEARDLGSPAPDGLADSLRDSFLEAESALRLSFYTGPGIVHHSGLAAVPRPSLIASRLPSPGREEAAARKPRDFDALVAELSRCVRSGDMETLNLALEQALHDSVEARSERVNEVKSFYSRLVFGVIERVGAGCGEGGCSLPEDYVAELMASATIFELVERVSELLSTLSSIVRSDREGGGGLVIARIMEFVDGNIGSEINLASVGEQLGMNPSYISKLFKLKTGGGFGDYVIGEKMKLAKKLIAQGEKLSAIAERTGYSDEAALSRAFKHSEGLSPSEFRRLRLG